MSANPTRFGGRADTPDPGSPLQQGNRVLESIARQEALRALLAFSDLHEQIRHRRQTPGNPDHDLFETERFILDEVLQLICDRAEAITQCEGVVIALAEGKDSEGKDIVCRAASGELAVARGVQLIGESGLLQECMRSGRILRCDDCETDARAELDFARVINARSTVLVPLRGQREQLGVLQAFSSGTRAFSDNDVRCFDLFAELVLSALKPEDQNRRVNWLSNVAGEVLRAKPALAVAATAAAADVAADVAVIAADQGLDAETVTLAAANAKSSDKEAVTAKRLGKENEREKENGGLNPLPAETSAPPESEPPTCFSLPVDSGAGSGLRRVWTLMAVTALLLVGTWWGVKAKGERIRETVNSARSATARLASTGFAGTRFASTRLTTFGKTFGDKKLAGAKPEVSPASGMAQVTGPNLVGRNVVGPNVVGLNVVGVNNDAASKSGAVSDDLMDRSAGGSDVAVLVVGSAGTASKITGVRHWSSTEESTVVIDMEDEVPYEVHRLASPERIYFDLHSTALAAELEGKTLDVGDATLSRVRVGQPVPGITRVVLDTHDGTNFSVSMESSPYRLVVKLHRGEMTAAANPMAAKSLSGKSSAAGLAERPWVPGNGVAAAKTAPLPVPSLSAALSEKAARPVLPAKTGKLRIVLDAGHGGWDLGTVGRHGLLEKDLVLDVTERLGKLLQARMGTEVLLTRSDDTYLPLDQRADIANQAQADLFVSVHANYSNSTSARGIETYYTNLFSSPGVREMEKHEDGSVVTPSPVSLTVEGLREKIDESRRLAASVQRSLYSTLAANSPDIRNRGIKDAAFVVLTGTTMPAILTEISFVSSPADEHNLQSPAYRQRVAEALYEGIARYQQSSPRAKVAQLRSDAAQR